MKSLARRLDQRDPESTLFVDAQGRKTSTSRFLREVGFASQTLWAEDVAAGHVAAWLGHNSTAMLAQLFACLRLGAVWLPLNWRLAPGELHAQLEHAGAAHLSSDDAHAEASAALRAQVPFLRMPAPGIEPGDAMLVYTSGTTGEPKAAVHTLAAMTANAEMAIDAQHLGPKTKALAVLPMFHVGGLAIQVLPTMVAGGQVMIHPRFDAEAWFDAVEQWRPTTSLLVPAVMRALLEHPRWAAADLAALKFVTAGSQIVPVELIEAFHDRGIAVAQVYGSTETGPVSLVVPPEDAEAHLRHSGRAARGVEVRLSAGGEILLRAPNLMRGYLRDPAPAFDAEGFFATGDLAQEHDGGWFQVVGRNNELIISGGENIHPAEIENLVRAWPGVGDCAVVGLPDPRWGEVPVLAVVVQPGSPFDPAALQTVFDERLARFKHPRRVVVVDELPKTALGKVQRQQLAQRLTQR